MAENTWNRERFAGGRARILLDVMADFANRRNRGRAGMTPQNLTRIPSFEENRQGEGHLPCGSTWALMVRETHPGDLSSWRGRGRGLSPPTPNTPPRPARSRRGRCLSPPAPTMPPLPVGRGRGRDFSPPSPSTTPTS